MTHDYDEAVMLTVKVNEKVIETLAPLMEQMDRLEYPDDLKILMWESVARKASTYAERCK